MSDTLLEIFTNKNNQDDLAIIIPESAPMPGKITYGQFYKTIKEFSATLASIVPAKSIVPGSNVSLSLPNSFEFAVAFLSLTFMSLTACPLNPDYTQEELDYYLKDTSSDILIVSKGTAWKQNNILVLEIYWNGHSMEFDYHLPYTVDHCQINHFYPQPCDHALLLHTSGSTGKPKGVPLTHLNLLTNMRNITNTYDLTRFDRTLLVMPLFHVHGLIGGFLSTLLSGGTVVIPRKFSASRFWKDFIDHQCTWYTAVPTIHQIMLKNPPLQVPRIRFIRSCSSSLAPATLVALEKLLKAPVLEAYAMTEASHQMTSNPLPHRGQHKPGSVGLGQGVEIAILDESGDPTEIGEICIRGKNVTLGYLNNPNATAESFTKDGFFRTGDQGRKDKDGYLFLTGRIKELINRGGEKISPIELDAVLLSHPQVEEAVCFGVPDDIYGQEVHAAVILKKSFKGNQTLLERELEAYCKSKLAKFKVPKRIYITNEMPKTSTGKIQRAKAASVFFNPNNNIEAKL